MYSYNIILLICRSIKFKHTHVYTHKRYFVNKSILCFVAQKQQQQQRDQQEQITGVMEQWNRAYWPIYNILHILVRQSVTLLLKNKKNTDF